MFSIIFILSSFFLLLTHEAVITRPDNEMILRDTAQYYYETLVDDVMSLHNEDLLTELSIMVRHPSQLTYFLRPQAEEIGLNVLSDICLAQMPGMIAYEVHDLSKEIYASIHTILNEHWTLSDGYFNDKIKNTMPHSTDAVVTELINALEVINTQVMESLIDVIDQFDLLTRLNAQLMSCQMGLEENLKFAQRIWSALLVSSKQQSTSKAGATVIFATRNNNNKRYGATGCFLSRYITELISDLESELITRLPELAMNVYQDMSYS